jgi:hypothetical protein
MESFITPLEFQLQQLLNAKGRFRAMLGKHAGEVNVTTNRALSQQRETLERREALGWALIVIMNTNLTLGISMEVQLRFAGHAVSNDLMVSIQLNAGADADGCWNNRLLRRLENGNFLDVTGPTPSQLTTTGQAAYLRFLGSMEHPADYSPEPQGWPKAFGHLKHITKFLDAELRVDDEPTPVDQARPTDVLLNEEST